MTHLEKINAVMELLGIPEGIASLSLQVDASRGIATVRYELPLEEDQEEDHEPAAACGDDESSTAKQATWS